MAPKSPIAIFWKSIYVRHRSTLLLIKLWVFACTVTAHQLFDKMRKSVPILYMLIKWWLRRDESLPTLFSIDSLFSLLSLHLLWSVGILEFPLDVLLYRADPCCFAFRCRPSAQVHLSLSLSFLYLINTVSLSAYFPQPSKGCHASFTITTE